MPEDPIGREIKQLREDSAEDFAQLRANLKEGLSDIRSALGGMVTREVHDAQLGRTLDKVDNVRRDLDRLIEAIENDRKAMAERRAADRRMVVGAMLAAAISIAVDVISATGGPV